MKVLWGKIISWAFTISGWMLTAIQWALNGIGYATVPDDAREAASLAEIFASWVLSLPWWGPFGFAFLLTLWVAFMSWRYPTRAQSFSQPLGREDKVAGSPVSTATSPKPAPSDPLSEAELERIDTLVGFFLDHIQPTISAATQLENAAIDRITTDKEVRTFMRRGRKGSPEMIALFSRYHDFQNRIADSPVNVPSLDFVIDCFAEIEGAFGELNSDVQRLLAHECIDPSADPEIVEAHEEYKQRFLALLEAYEPIKRSSKFGRLFRPGRPKWVSLESVEWRKR